MLACAAAVVLLLAGAPVLLAFDMSQCIAPLGMENGLIPDKDISASSCYNDGNVAPQNGRLNQDIAGGAWCPRSQITTETTEWLEVDLRQVHVVTAVGTQGRFGNGQGQEYAEAYIIEYWRPRLGKWLRYRTTEGQEILTGNTNTYLEKKNHLQPVWASKIRFIPHSAHRRTVCMRAEIYGCPWTVGIVSYSIPGGDKRSNGVELSDATYDGVWSEGELRGGLGQLVDGVYGTDDIREAARASAWVGWRNDSRPDPPAMLFEFDRVREFTAVHIYCNNKFMRDVQIFSAAVISFSIGGRQFQEDPVRYSHVSDGIFESSRNVTIKLHHRIARWVRIELHFAARWILVSEVVFDSDVAQGNYTAERRRPAAAAAAEGTGAGGAAGGAGGGGGVPRGALPAGSDPLYAAVVVGVLTALAILLAVAVAILVHRHRHRKCFASTPHAADNNTNKRNIDHYSACGTAMLCDKAALESAGSMPASMEAKCSEYQEPYQALRCAPYFAYSTVLLEMNNYHSHEHNDAHNHNTESSTYEYAVPELSSAPLLDAHSDEHTHTHTRTCSTTDTSVSGREAVAAMRRRFESGTVYEFPRHRLRMISKLAEGAFGTVFVAEADGVASYEGDVTADKRLVAVKFLAPDAAHTDREQFERDVRVLSSLSHPRLSRVVGACRTPPLALVLEYLPGGDLHTFLRNTTPAPSQPALLHLAEQLADGMHYLETLNFVHRDLAARNCLVGPSYTLKIGDLGTDMESFSEDYYHGCGVYGSSGAGGETSVPVRWSAWEAALHGHHSTASDVWAFAVTLYEIFTLCRRRPYYHLTDIQVVENMVHLEAEDGRFEMLERARLCPRELHHLMVACWNRHAHHRPTFAQAHLFLQRKTLMSSNT